MFVRIQEGPELDVLTGFSFCSCILAVFREGKKVLSSNLIRDEERDVNFAKSVSCFYA